MKEMPKASSLLFICFVATFALWVRTSAFNPVPDPVAFELNLDKVIKIKVSSFGARLMAVFVPDGYGRMEDILLGYDTIQEYMDDKHSMGAVVGRVANVIGGAKFTLNNVVHNLKSDHPDLYNGGAKAFDKVIWDAIEIKNEGPNPTITLAHHSRDGDDGFPGAVDANVTYTLDKAWGVMVKMTAIPLTKATPINMAHYAYWNLGGNRTHNVKTHEVQISGSDIIELDKNKVPTGVIKNIRDTCYDFNQQEKVDFKLKKLNDEWGSYYSFNNYYIFNEGIGAIKAHLFVNKTGRIMQLESNQPGLQFSTADYLEGERGKHGIVYGRHSGITLIPQGYPDAVNHPTWPQYIIKPGERYENYVNYILSSLLVPQTVQKFSEL